MLLESYAYIPLAILAASGAVILLTRNWRIRLGALAFQYVGVFWLVALSWPVGLASIKLVTGWMSGAILGVSRVGQLPLDRRRWPTERLFLALVIGLVILSVVNISPSLSNWVITIRPSQSFGGLLLIAMGLVHLGIASRGLRVIVSLLTLLSGFEILYAVVENSTLVAGLLAVVNLGVAMVGAYLLSGITEAEEVE